jgi:hypothetical protein
MRGRTTLYFLFLCYSGMSIKAPLLRFLSRVDFLHSFEAFSRTCVSGLILDPEVPLSAIFTSPFSTDHSIRIVSNAPVVHPAIGSSTYPPTNLGRNGTLLHRLRNFYGNATRPFALSNPTSSNYNFAPLGATSAAASSATLVNPAPPARNRADTSTTLLEKTSSLSSAVTAPAYPPAQEMLVLPFQFSMRLARDITRRNLPYLRHSWTRIDAIAVVAFWITFILAQTGVERGRYHIGIFRALSVLRTARLLTITSGTTVSATSRGSFSTWTDRSRNSLPHSFFADHHALTQNRAPAACQCGVFCAFCHGFVFVCPLPVHDGQSNLFEADGSFSPGSSAFRHLRARSAGRATWSRPSVRSRPSSVKRAAGTLTRVTSL